ncbi:MAG: SulP family inorganic anion transporter [Polyangiales bacterium]
MSHPKTTTPHRDSRPAAGRRTQPPPPRKFGRDLLASAVVFLVALPLCMGIAIASGVPVGLGLISGVIGGIVAGSLAGSPLQVSGPAAGLAVLIWDFVHTHDLNALGVVVLVAGLLQLASGMLRLGTWFRAVSPAVIQGMLAGIGVIIFASQFHVMLGGAPQSSPLLNLISIPQAVYASIMAGPGVHQELSALTGILTVSVLVAWNAWRPRSLQAIPAPLVAVVVATVNAAAFALPIHYVDIPDSLAASFNIPAWRQFGLLTQPSVMVAAAALAIIASAETLLCATATDRMHSGPRTDYDKELRAQGVSNIVCGVFGALPTTGVIVRSSANIEAGATSRWSAILHGFWLLAFVAFLPFVLKHIPTASLAAVLVYTGYRLVNWQAIRQLKAAGSGEIWVYSATLVGVVGTSLLTGVAIGLVLATGKLLLHLVRLDVRVEGDEDNGRFDVHLRGAATFVQLPKLAQALERIPPGVEAHLHFEHLDYVDHACLDLIRNWEKTHREQGGEAIVDWDVL